MQHPLNPILALPYVLSDAIEIMITQGFHTVASRRAEIFKHWTARVHELESVESGLGANIDAGVSNAVPGQRIALFAEMLKHYYPDIGVVGKLLTRASLTGEAA